MMSQLRTTAYHTLSVDDHYSKEMKESNIKEQARLRCGFFCIGLLIPSAIVLLFTVSNSSRRQGSWRPEPRRDAVGWRTTHQAYVREIRETGKDLRVILYGDSITESWRGTSRGQAVPRAEGIPIVWNSTFADRYGSEAAAFGISGDCTRHLLWRLEKGEVTTDMNPAVIVLLIGTNDLSECDMHLHGCEMEEFAPGVAEHIRDIALVLHRKLPQAQILLHALMPRASRFLITEEEPAEFYQQPSIYSPYIAMVNGLLKAFSADWDWATCLDCSNVFLEKDPDRPMQFRISKDLMPDGLHPGMDGAAKWAECLLPAVTKIDPEARDKKARDADVPDEGRAP